MSDFGERLRRWRRAAGLGLRTFAALVDQRASVVSAIERGQRRPWRDSVIIGRVAQALGADLDSAEYEQLLTVAMATGGAKQSEEAAEQPGFTAGDALLWFNGAADVPLDDCEVRELAEFLGVSLAVTGDANGGAPGDHAAADPLPLTDLAMEWRARRTLGRRATAHASAAVDVEAALEDAGWRIVALPGLLPRFSVGACAVQLADGGRALAVDRVHADVRPLAQYRLLLAATAAPLALADDVATARQVAAADGSRRRCEQFALAMLLPAQVVGAAAERTYRELALRSGIPRFEVAQRELRNRLATQLAAPPELVDRRLAAWPCRTYDRLRLAIAAEEPTLPPVDWLPEWRPTRQQRLFS